MQEFIAKRGVTKLPGLGDPALAAINRESTHAQIDGYSEHWKRLTGIGLSAQKKKDELEELPPEIPVGRNGKPMTAEQIQRNANQREYQRKKRLSST